MWIDLLIYFIYDLDHWSCLWPWPWMSKVKSWKCHIYEISDLIAKKWKKGGEFFGWFNILFIISDLRLTFIVCYSVVQVWRFCRWEHQYELIPVATAMMCIYNIRHAGVLFLASLHIHTAYVWNSQICRTQTWYKLWSNLLQLFNNIWNADRLMEGWTGDDYTVWPRAKWEYCRRIQYCISMKQWIALEICREYWNK